MKSKKISILLFILAIVLSIVFSEYIKVFMNNSIQQIREKMTNGPDPRDAAALPAELQSVHTQYFDNRQ